MAYEGFVEFTSPTEIRGWIFDNSHPNQPLTLEIFADHRLVASISADQFRSDLAAAAKGNGAHAFYFKLNSHPGSTPLTARVAGKRWFLQLLNGGSGVSSRAEWSLAHSLDYGLPQVETGFSAAYGFADEIAVVERLVEAYHRALQDDPERQNSKADLWTEVSRACHQEILELLRRRDVRGVANYLSDAHARGITFGISQGDATTATLRNDLNARRFVATQYADYLASLAEFLGILDIESPEQHGQWSENLHADVQTLINKISSAIGCPIVPPESIGSHFGLKTSTGILAGRDLLALYAALRLMQIGRNEQIQFPSICEIGGGFGGVAYYATKLRVRQYTIIDLPLISVLQGYFLLRSLPGARIQLYGESPTEPAAIRLLPTYRFAMESTQYDLLLNQDSMPEMHREYSVNYLRHARTCVKHGFLSINQEARAHQNSSNLQTVVRELAKEAGGYHLQYRFRHWLRAGYAEEFYRLGNG
jgi:hypothetical protein